MKLKRYLHTPRSHGKKADARSAPLPSVRLKPVRQVVEAPVKPLQAEPPAAALATAGVQEARSRSLNWSETWMSKVSPFNMRAFETQLNQWSGSIARPGNRVDLLFDGIESFTARDVLISRAKKSINLQTFIFNSDETGWALARQLAQKAREGVKVRVVYDAAGSKRADPKMFAMMREAGVEVLEYGPLAKVWAMNQRGHEKHLIVDGEVSIEGGMNIADEYALGGTELPVLTRGEPETGWRDCDVMIRGPAVCDAQAAFLRTWKELGGVVSDEERAELMAVPPSEPDDVSVRVIQHDPKQTGEQNVTHLYLECIEAAEKSITIENAYFIPTPQLRDALISAAKRGVEVKIMTNSRETNDTRAVADAARHFYDELIAAGVQIFEVQDLTLHAKTATFDGLYSIVGSANLNRRSHGLDTETAIAMRGESVAKQLEQRFERGLAQTRRVTLEELAKQPLLTRLRQWAYSNLAWTF